MPILNHIADLSTAEMMEPVDIMESFLTNTNLEELWVLFSDILETCLTSNSFAFDTGEKRLNLIMNLRDLECFIQATSLFLNIENDQSQS